MSSSLFYVEWRTRLCVTQAQATVSVLWLWQ